MTGLLNHRLEGPEHGTPLILGPSLGTSLRVWDQQISALARHHRVLRFDLPGHGGSAATPRAATVSELADLVLDLAAAQGWDTFHYAGVSLGGAIGAQLATHHPGRLLSLAMVCSSARFGEPEGWLERAALVREHGTGPLVDVAAGRWFFDPQNPLGTPLLEDLAGTDPEGYASCCDALASYDLTGSLKSISARTLVIAGRADPTMTSAPARFLADEIADASLVEVAGAAHLALVDRPETVTAALLSHLGITGPDQYAQGMAVRRAVLGDAHVDRAVAATTDLTADFQDFITRYAWGEIWTRPGLDRRTRSCITLTALVAHGHHKELAMHLRAALTNGLTPEEIKEVLLQTAVYCGVPAANAAFAIAQEVLADPAQA
jgi:3-oxoadipate enol-lactonase/4-carboxymuconolactone decarboxylase